MTRWRLAAAVFWTLMIMVLCWMPIGMIPTGGGGEHPRIFPHFDKVVHAGVFAVFGVLWLRAIPDKRRFLAVAVAGLALAVVTEYGQSLPIVGRDGGVADGLADMIGVALAYPLLLFASRRERDGQAGPIASAVAEG